MSVLDQSTLLDKILDHTVPRRRNILTLFLTINPSINLVADGSQPALTIMNQQGDIWSLWTHWARSPAGDVQLEERFMPLGEPQTQQLSMASTTRTGSTLSF